MAVVLLGQSRVTFHGFTHCIASDGGGNPNAKNTHGQTLIVSILTHRKDIASPFYIPSQLCHTSCFPVFTDQSYHEMLPKVSTTFQKCHGKSSFPPREIPKVRMPLGPWRCHTKQGDYSFLPHSSSAKTKLAPTSVC